MLISALLVTYKSPFDYLTFELCLYLLVTLLLAKLDLVLEKIEFLLRIIGGLVPYTPSPFMKALYSS